MRQNAEGGLAIDAAGRAIGMTVFGPRRRVLVIPSATIERVAASLEKHGHIPRGYLGLGFQLVAVEGGTRGVMVMKVEPQGPGAKAGAPGRYHRHMERWAHSSCAIALARAWTGQRRPEGHPWTAPRRRDKERSADDRRKANHLSKSAATLETKVTSADSVAPTSCKPRHGREQSRSASARSSMVSAEFTQVCAYNVLCLDASMQS
jgi:S1-C subfamily serine protease